MRADSRVHRFGSVKSLDVLDECLARFLGAAINCYDGLVSHLQVSKAQCDGVAAAFTVADWKKIYFICHLVLFLKPRWKSGPWGTHRTCAGTPATQPQRTHPRRVWLRREAPPIRCTRRKSAPHNSSVMRDSAALRHS